MENNGGIRWTERIGKTAGVPAPNGGFALSEFGDESAANPGNRKFPARSGGTGDGLARIWELAPNLRCPVIGTCMEDAELRKILTKTGHRAKHLTSFQLHVGIMDRIGDENPVSRKVDGALRRKYRESVGEYGKLEEPRFMELWREKVRIGAEEFVDLFYVSSHRRDLSEAAATEIYGDIHMMGHARTRTAASTSRTLETEQRRAGRAEARVARETERNRILKEKNQGLTGELREAHERIAHLSFTCACLRKCENRPRGTGADVEKSALRKEIETLRTENRRLAKEANRVEREKRKFQIELFELRGIRDELSLEIETLISRFGDMARCGAERDPESCPEYAHCAKRILIVGGMTRIRHLYQALVESRGGEFDYHDGYMQNGQRNIEAQVRRSDIVICPVNCNSHGACERVKRLCKKHEKPFRMLPSSSLSAIAEALHSAN